MQCRGIIKINKMIFQLKDRPVIDQMLEIELVPTSQSFAQAPGLCFPCPVVGCAYVLAALALLFAAPGSCRQLFPPYHLPILDCFTLSCRALKRISHKAGVNQHMPYIYLWRTELLLVLSVKDNSLCQYPKVSGAILRSTNLLHLTIKINQAFESWKGWNALQSRRNIVNSDFSYKLTLTESQARKTSHRNDLPWS